MLHAPRQKPRVIPSPSEGPKAARYLQPPGGLMSINSFLAKWINFLNNDPRAQSITIHSLAGVTIVFHLGTVLPIRTVMFGFVAAVAAKEFLWDTKYESPPQSEEGAATDFVGWVLGGTLALVLHHFGV